MVCIYLWHDFRNGEIDVIKGCTDDNIPAVLLVKALQNHYFYTKKIV
jgi:hypothetical protein